LSDIFAELLKGRLSDVLNTTRDAGTIDLDVSLLEESLKGEKGGIARDGQAVFMSHPGRRLEVIFMLW
jgi:hypothetical protein